MNMLAKKMEPDVNVTRSVLVKGVQNEIDGSFVVTEQDCGRDG